MPHHIKEGGGIVGEASGKYIWNYIDGKYEVAEGGEHHQPILHRESLVESGIVEYQDKMNCPDTCFPGEFPYLVKKRVGVVVPGIFL